MKFEELVASLIKQHRKKYPFNGYLYLTGKQYNFYDSLFRQLISEIEKTSDWKHPKYELIKDGREIPFLYRKNSTFIFKFGRKIQSKSFSITTYENKNIWISNNRDYFLLKIKGH